MVTNIGTATASFVSPFGFTTREADQGDFGEQPSPWHQPAAESSTVAVTFTPTASGARTAVFAVVLGSAIVQIPVSGTGTP